MRNKPFQDYVQAYKWLSLGGPSMPREGYMPRRLSLEDVAAHRSGTQVSLARKLVGEWKAKNIYIDTISRLTYKLVGKLDVFGVADAVGDIPQNVNFAVKGSVATSFVEAHTPDLETTETAVIGQWKTSLTWLARLRFSFDVWTKSEHEQPTSLRSKRAGFV